MRALVGLFAATVGLASPVLAQEADFDTAVRDQLAGDPAAYHQVVEGFQKAVRDRDAAAAAALVTYPIGVSIDGKAVTIRSPQEFAEKFSAIVTPAIAAAVVDEPTSEMMVNYQGVMLGRGEVWINGICSDDACKNSDVKVVTIQAGPDETPAPADSGPTTVGALKSFGDWVVGCDNLRGCTAIGMGPDEDISGYVVVRRGGEAQDAAAVTLNVLASDAPKDPTVQVAFGAGKARFPVTVLPVEAQGGFLVSPIDAEMAPDLIAALATSTLLRLTEIDGNTKAEPQVISLKGSAAALLYMDDQQERVGTDTALIRPGTSPAAGIPPVPSPVAPKLVAMAALPDPLPPLPAGVTPPDDPSCTTDFAPMAFRLSATETLWGVCTIAGAYNIDYIMWIVGPDGARKADFTVPGVPLSDGEDVADMTNPSLSADGLGINATAKGRGLGDCGSASDWGWDGAKFVLLQYSEMDACRGVDVSDWPILHRAEPL